MKYHSGANFVMMKLFLRWLKSGDGWECGFMRFALELSNMSKKFRFQKNSSWRCYGNDDSLQETDFWATDPHAITLKSNLCGQTITLDGIKYEINQESWSTEKELYYGSLVFRHDFPESPQMEQLREVIAQGDDSKNYCLILNVHGLFELREMAHFNIHENDPAIVVHHESFGRDNGYVGLRASRHPFVEDLYVSYMECWFNHLCNHSTSEYTDIDSTESFKEVVGKLHKLHESWIPAY